MKKFVPGIGLSDFQKLREFGASYVDKTFVLRQILHDPTEVLLFPRPRRFGKTLTLSALAYFLRKSKQDVSPLFEGLEVTRDEHAMKHFQKHPVITVSFKDVKAKTLAATMVGIREQMVMAFAEHRWLLDENKLEASMADAFRRILSRTVANDELPYAFRWLSQALYEHHGERVAILIDEYDTPVQSGYMYDFFDDIVLFFRNFFSACLKDNPALFKGVLTGILRVSKENMFSGLNHIKVHSIIDEPYATAFGFTEDEVAAIIEPEKLEEVRAWYNGYLFGGQVIYNPWSILHYIDEGKLKPYWVNSGSSDLIEHLAARKGLALSDQSYSLLRGETIEVRIDDNIVLRDIELRTDALWNFLLFSGYLKLATLVLHEGRYIGTLCIPNQEIRHVYEDMFRNWVERADPDWAVTKDLVNALCTGDAGQVQETLEQILLTAMSFQDPAGRAPEKLYHGLMLGLLVHLESRYEIRSNRESGRGRADVWMRPRTPGRPGVVMEFKVPLRKETPEVALEKAETQIRERKYRTELVASGASPVYEYAMVFDGKKAWVKKVEELVG